jgi:hypothetical protein
MKKLEKSDVVDDDVHILHACKRYATRSSGRSLAVSNWPPLHEVSPFFAIFILAKTTEMQVRQRTTVQNIKK